MTRVALALLTLLACALPAASAEQQVPEQLRGFPEATVTITRTDGRDTFRVWVADTPRRQQQGLMFVREMAADRGMLFPQAQPRDMSMWMKNTYLSLDMVFIGPDGRIIGIATETKPLSLETISAPGPVSAVLEMNAGESKRRGIAVGDRVDVGPVRPAAR
jgi:uncharacterized membrane protein (UPF0127 family)